MKIVYVTFPGEKSCKDICRKLVKERLAAGVNFDSINSIYWWQHEIQEEIEFRAFFKTREEKVDLLKERILELHPYETPCIAVLEASANQDFEDWVDKEVK